MSQHHFYTLLLLSSCLLTSCNETTPQLEIAYEVYENNMKGVELFESLSEEQKIHIRRHIDGWSYGSTPFLNEFRGKPSNIFTSTFTKKVSRITTYRKPKERLLPKGMTYHDLVKQKQKCIKSITEFNQEGLPINRDSTLYKYENGKLILNENKEYSYSEDQTVITYPNRNTNIEERYIWADSSLTMTKYIDGKQTKTGSITKYNEDLQRTELKSTSDYGFESIYKFYAIFEYNEFKRLIKDVIESSSIRDGISTKYSTKIRTYTYNSIGLVDRKIEPKSWFIKVFARESNQSNYYYNFFTDEEGLLNVYKLICPKYRSPKRGYLAHYIFDENSNELYSLSQNFRNNIPHSHFNEYEYFDEDETIE